MVDYPRTTQEIKDFMSESVGVFLMRLVTHATEEEVQLFLTSNGPQPTIVAEGCVLIPSSMNSAKEVIMALGRVALHSFADSMAETTDEGSLFLDRPPDDDPTRN